MRSCWPRRACSPHREGGQAQYVEHPLPPPSSLDLRPTLDWALERLEQPLSVEALARHARMGARTFARRFKAVTGTTPHEWLLEQRLGLARRMLETSDRSVEWIAHHAGFGSAATMRHHFQQRLHTSPNRYRRTFRARAS